MSSWTATTKLFLLIKAESFRFGIELSKVLASSKKRSGNVISSSILSSFPGSTSPPPLRKLDDLNNGKFVIIRTPGDGTSIRASPDNGCCVAHGNMVHIYDWMLEEYPPITLDYLHVNDACWVGPVDPTGLVISTCEAGNGLFDSTTGELKYKFDVTYEGLVKSYTSSALTFDDGCNIFSRCKEYVAMLDKLDLGDGRLLFSHFKIPCTCLDDGLVPLMADEDGVKLLEYIHRFKEVDVYDEKDVLTIEQDMKKYETRNGKKNSDQFAFKNLLAEIDLEIGYKIAQMKEKLSQENPSLDEIFDDVNSSLDIVIAKLSQDDMNMPWGTVAPIRMMMLA
ncbi:hypothetical protein Tco_0967521 [Tanacetum coccineum]